jgi:hypothetical protein
MRLAIRSDDPGVSIVGDPSMLTYLARCQWAAQLRHGRPPGEEAGDPQALVGRYRPLPLHGHDIFAAPGIVGVILEVVVVQQDLEDRHLAAAIDHDEVGDREHFPRDASDSHVAIVGMMHEDPGAGLQCLQRPAPASAAAGGDVAPGAGVLPRALQVVAEHDVVEPFHSPGVRLGSRSRASSSAACGSFNQAPA